MKVQSDKLTKLNI